MCDMCMVVGVCMVWSVSGVAFEFVCVVWLVYVYGRGMLCACK